MGLLVSARDPYNQAVYTVRKPKNTYDSDSETLTQGAVNNFNEIMDILGIEPGKKCDPSKCTMSMILLLPDGDVDGDGICITLAGLFAKHCKPLIDAGMVGRILPPLYSYREGKKKKFIQSKRKFLNMITEKFLTNINVSYKGKQLSKKDLKELLDMNMDYDTRLNKLSDYYCCDPRLMEYVVWKYHGTVADQKKSYWMTAMKPYGELKVLLEGGKVVIDGEIPGYDYVNLCLDDQLDHRMKKFKAIQSKNRHIDGYSINGKDGKTLYDIMSSMRDYMPDDVKYYKGLGELSVDEMSELCMDPKKRTVIIFKFKDYEEDMRKLSIILSGRKEYSDLRMEILSSCTLDEPDLAT